jgi:hypothetical protein
MNPAKSITRSTIGLAGLVVFATLATTVIYAAEPLVMQVIDEPVRGSDEIAREEYEQAIAQSLVVVERYNFTKSKLAVLTNLCIGYTMTRQFEEATEFCNHAVEIGQYEWITLNNRAVLNYLKRDFQASADDLNLASDTGHADWQATEANLRQVEIQLAAMEAYQSAVARSE